MLLAANRSGGIVLGAYSNLGDLIGFAFSILALEGASLIQLSYMLAVRAAYRNFDVGFKLEMALRKESLKRKSRRSSRPLIPCSPQMPIFP
jgi:predicted GNAT superfamily acetyltransferase